MWIWEPLERYYFRDFWRIRDGGTTHGAQLIHLHNIPVRQDCGGTASLLSRRLQINTEVVCDGRPSGQPGEIAPQRQDSVNTIRMWKIWSLENAYKWRSGPGTRTTTDECSAITEKHIGTRSYFVKLIVSFWES